MATEISGVFGSEIRDTQGEILDVRGADISELEAGRGVINDNHSNKLPDVIGRVTYAKKIFGPEDCEDEDQKAMWNRIKAPLIYGKGVLFDDQDHRSAKAAAAIIRHQHAFDAPLKMKCSVEGGILERGKSDDRILKRTKIKGLALTLSPANNATIIQGLNLQKSATTPEEQRLIKSLIPLAKSYVPTFIETADAISESKIAANVRRINKLVKTLAAGYGGAGAPTNLTGGGVLQTESMAQAKKNDSEIECPECGKAQHYFRYQTRCRHCSKSFPMDTLVNFFTRSR